MVALFLTILGSAYLYHGFINKRVKEVAILTCLGATKATALKTYLLQLSMLGAASATAAIFICFLAIPMLSGTLSGFTPMNLEATLHPASLPLTFLVAVVSGWLLALPSLTKIIRLRPALLFQEASSPQNSKSKTSWLYALPALLGFLGLMSVAIGLRKLGQPILSVSPWQHSDSLCHRFVGLVRWPAEFSGKPP